MLEVKVRMAVQEICICFMFLDPCDRPSTMAVCIASVDHAGRADLDSSCPASQCHSHWLKRHHFSFFDISFDIYSIDDDLQWILSSK